MSNYCQDNFNPPHCCFPAKCFCVMFLSFFDKKIKHPKTISKILL